MYILYDGMKYDLEVDENNIVRFRRLSDESITHTLERLRREGKFGRRQYSHVMAMFNNSINTWELSLPDKSGYIYVDDKGGKHYYFNK